jgi:hypothetical protein
MEYWNDGVHGYMTLIEVREPSACGELEAEGQEFFALCPRSFVPQDKLSDPQTECSLGKNNAFWF